MIKERSDGFNRTIVDSKVSIDEILVKFNYTIIYVPVGEKEEAGDKMENLVSREPINTTEKI